MGDGRCKAELPPAAPLSTWKGAGKTLGGGQGGNFVPTQPSPQTPGDVRRRCGSIRLYRCEFVQLVSACSRGKSGCRPSAYGRQDLGAVAFLLVPTMPHKPIRRFQRSAHWQSARSANGGPYKRGTRGLDGGNAAMMNHGPTGPQPFTPGVGTAAFGGPSPDDHVGPPYMAAAPTRPPMPTVGAAIGRPLPCPRYVCQAALI